MPEDLMDTMSMVMHGNIDSPLFLGLQETIGPADAAKLLDLLNSGTDLNGDVRRKMDEMYGKAGASGVAICSGRAAFKYLLEKDGKAIGFDDPDFRFLPIRIKMRKGLELLARWFELNYGVKTSLNSEEKEFRIEVKDSVGSSSNTNLCDFTSGLLQGFLAWISGGKFYVVRETECRASGAEKCSFSVGKNPLE